MKNLKRHLWVALVCLALVALGCNKTSGRSDSQIASDIQNKIFSDSNVPDKQITMLAGLAPIADQSGKRDGARVVFGGRPRVRRILYLAALSAARFNADMRAFYQRLRAAGKPPKAALIAVARKLVVLANTLISQDRMWQPMAPQYA